MRADGAAANAQTDEQAVDPDPDPDAAFARQRARAIGALELVSAHIAVAVSTLRWAPEDKATVHAAVTHMKHRLAQAGDALDGFARLNAEPASVTPAAPAAPAAPAERVH
jgi:hypothetical protein